MHQNGEENNLVFYRFKTIRRYSLLYLFESKSLQIADRVVEKIFDSTAILKTQAEVYEIDKQKKPKNVNFRTYFVYNYKVSYQITEEKINILRVRHTAKKPKKL